MTMPPDLDAPEIRHYFVDEAGDATIFNAQGRVIVGDEGCSTHFALGVLDLPDAVALGADLDALRRSLIANPFFKGVPSMDPARGRTGVYFHAKDDPAEVRWEVFKILANHAMTFYAVIRDKRGLAVDVQNRNRQSVTYRYHPNRLYDEMVKRLFKDRLHKDAAYRVCFATRGNRDRTAALRAALSAARENFRRAWGHSSDAPIEVSAVAAQHSAGLQAVDYFLWALQRLYVRGEDRYVAFLASKIALIHDVDDRRKSLYGVYYTRDKPISATAIKKETPGI